MCVSEVENMILMFQQAIAKLRLKLRALEVNNNSLPGRSTSAPMLFLMPCLSYLRVKIKDGSGMKAQLGNGSSGDPIAQVFDTTFET